MTRRPAADRFADLPEPTAEPPQGEVLADAIRALAHPRRRALLDLLVARGPAPVGRLARWSGMAVGSVSHHTRVLARGGFIEPAPELAGDTRESWWRPVHRTLTWGESSFAPGTAGAELAQAAASSNLDYLLSAARAWQSRRAGDTWRGSVTDVYLAASQEQLDDLAGRLAQVIAQWEGECRAAGPAADEVRGVRAMAIVFPDAEGAASPSQAGGVPRA